MSGSVEPPSVPVMKEPSSQSSSSKEQPKCESKMRLRNLVGLILIVAFMLLATVVWILGDFDLRDLLSSIGRITGNAVNYEFIDARNNAVLLVMQQGDQSSVKVRLAEQHNWIEIATSDDTVSNPALSPSGGYVAYLSEQDGRHIVVAPVITGTEHIVTTALVQQSSDLVESAEICAWSPIRWSPNERYLSFFACVKDAETSYVVVVDLQSTPVSVVCLDKEHSKSTVLSERTLIWQDNQELIVTTFGENRSDIRVESLDFP